MHPRQSIIDKFSTFIQFDAERFLGWAKDGRLRRSIQSCINQNPEETSENIWAMYWHRRWQKEKLATLPRQHLNAYLQEPCYWSSQKLAQTFTNTHHSLPDFFQIGITQIERVLKGFNPSQGSILKNYASIIFSSIIRETLRQRHEIDICSTWGMLRKTSQKRLVESLEAAGLPKQTIANYTNAWICYQSIYAPSQANTSRKLARPDDKTWNAITKAYNLTAPSQVSAQTLESWMQNCAKAIRNYLYPTVQSINTPTGSEDTYEIIDNISSGEDSLLTQIITEEEHLNRTSQIAQMNQVLGEAINKLEFEAQQILKLYYTQGLTQQQIASSLQIPQYTISRRLNKIRETLLKTLASWSKEKLHISITSDILKSMNSVMEQWLQSYYTNL
ncbi:MAG: sigma-70 family RNA polymerase sigma factor [Calothrix sp. C42_A2020_038]|nr:sigma-70 family RNA polymerase sigma factor [Calothrix sp. C42_A2020_038]